LSAFNQLPNKYQLTLLRHGESVGNANGYYQGQVDFPLSSRGEKQAKSLSNLWLEEKRSFDHIFSSPLARARQTAEIIANDHNIPLEFDEIWLERDAGLLSGLHEKEAEKRMPTPDFIHLYQPYATTGESTWSLYLRAGRAIQKIIDQPSGKYLVVSHGGILNMVMYAILGILPQANFHGAYFYFENTGYSLFSYYPDNHNWVLENFNATYHLYGI